ncbi:MAG: glycosyl hydrolase family 28 protein [bacterium]|nr:glycosyl hydrolase family 28 protein [bacterium]
MSKIYRITEFGAISDGVTNNAKAIQKAINKAAVTGGTVIVPAGNFLSGTIVLKSNIELHLEAGAVLISSLKEEDILDFASLFEDENKETGWDGGCFLFACHQKNITISGEGTIYGQGDKVFFDDDTDGGFHESPKNVTAFRPRTTFFEDVTNLTIKDITIKDAAFWTLHMAGCNHVLVSQIKILNDVRGANNDGIDPDCCKDVIITGCIVKTGDDAIVVKSTKPMAEKYGSCENIVISNCILYSHDSALKIGTETHGDIRNVILSDCIAKDCSRGVGIWVRDGATIEDIHIHNVTGSVRKYADAIREDGPAMWWGNGEAIFINATNRKGKVNYPGKIKNVTFDHIYMKAESSIFIGGEEYSKIEDVILSDIDLTLVKQGTQASGYFDEQPSNRHVYPHKIPAVYLRYVDGIQVHGRVKFGEGYSLEENGLYEIIGCQKEQIALREK